MKKSNTILIVLCLAFLFQISSAFAQVPQKISYQAVVRNSDQALVVDQPIGMQISIIKNDGSETIVYLETQTPNSNANGLISIEIGAGEGTDDFSSIVWTDADYMVKTEIDLSGGTNYELISESQLLSVPYALVAEKTNSFSGTITESQISDLQTYLTTEQDGNVYNEIQTLQDVINEDNDANSMIISNLGDPVDAQDAATKAYVDLLETQIEALNAQMNTLEDFITSNLEIGDFYGGGVVFHIFQDGEYGYIAGETHGLICAVNNLEPAPWDDNSTLYFHGANESLIGTGISNTSIMLDELQGEWENLVAYYCDQYSSNGYTDWFIPASGGLDEIFNHKTTINATALANGGSSFVVGPYWSSTEVDAENAVSMYFDDGTAGSESKNTNRTIRPVRKF